MNPPPVVAPHPLRGGAESDRPLPLAPRPPGGRSHGLELAVTGPGGAAPQSYAAVHRDPMRQAIFAAQRARTVSSPNPWVGCVVVDAGGETFTGSTEAVGGRHAEVVALDAAGPRARGATLYVTLEPCSHFGRTPPCTRSIIEAGVARVVVGVSDPDPRVSGQGIGQLRAAGIEVTVGVEAERVAEQLRAYLHHRTTGRPWVSLKTAMTADGKIAARDGTSQWITGPEARRDVHRLRAEADAVLVGAGTVRCDDPALTVRDWHPEHSAGSQFLDPRPIVLGRVPIGAQLASRSDLVECTGPLDELLVRLGGEDVLQRLVEGGASVAGAFHDAGLVDEYVLYLAPVILGDPLAPGVFGGTGAPTLAGAFRSEFNSVEQFGDDLRLVIRSPKSAGSQARET